MKMKKRLSILAAFMLLLMITFPVTGVFAAENSEQEAKIKENSKKGEQNQKNNEAAEKSADQKGKSNGDVKAASTKNDPESKEDTDSESIGQAKNNSVQETNNPDESENSVSQEDNQEQNTEENNGQEDNTAANSENESTPAEDGTVPGNDNKSTQIHLHIDQCVNPVETAYVQISGEWQEMTNLGSSPLFKAFDDGEFIKDDVTAFKLIFTAGEELVVPVGEVKVGVEAEGSVNYWLESCELPAEEPSEKDDSEDTDETLKLLSMIKIMIDENPRQIEKVTLLMMSGKRVDFERVNELFSLTLTEAVQLELIRGIEITSQGETKLILLSNIESLEIVESVLTLQVNWGMNGEIVEEETEEADTEEENETTAPGNNSGSGNTSDGTTNEQVWNGEVLPQTGENSRTMFYVLGFLIAAGGVMLRFRNPLKN
ncbi:LPXTG cell wall anchor domain-containing protein [Mesobacillus subterraneus]|uniref:LPXTG cell wall anchor domain-containing protein n=1 Tax=Mesobacillus subterraneus TaxID=285983 RepID=UPI00203B3AF1|nr:LPXTG cell wall anchor domain-containing protein [Mesobacillus subterraneus]MCM3574384.1 LPXTG cell wall anchor domain-containing protein [Mesobacillus subterraneus]